MNRADIKGRTWYRFSIAGWKQTCLLYLQGCDPYKELLGSHLPPCYTAQRPTSMAVDDEIDSYGLTRDDMLRLLMRFFPRVRDFRLEVR